MDSLSFLTDFDAKYRLVEQISEGATGVLWVAEHRELKRRTAVKFLSQAALPVMPDVKERFYAEARLLAQINHPHIVQVFDFGIKDDSPFIVFEYIQGETLGDRIARAGSDGLPFEEIVELAIQMAEAFTYCHEHGVLHRDIKPDNVLLLPEGQVKVIDFGVSRYPGRDALQTQEGVILGTPDYMAPEYFTGGEITFKVDIYAFGVVLYAMVAGRLPFSADSDMEIFSKHVSEYAAPLSELRADCPPRLQGLVERCLEKDVEDRYPDFATLLQDLLDMRASAPEHRDPLDGTEPSLARPNLNATAPSLPVTPPAKGGQKTEVSSRPAWPAAGGGGDGVDVDDGPSLGVQVKRNLEEMSSQDLKWAAILAACILIFFFGFGFPSWGSRPDMEGVELHWSAEEGASLHWKTSSPMVGTLLLDDGQASPRPFGPKTGEAVTTHHVQLPVLTSGRRYGLRFPGTSLSSPQFCQMGHGPELLDFAIAGEISAPVLRWRSSTPMRFEVLATQRGKETLIHRDEAEGREHSCKLTGLDPEACHVLQVRSAFGTLPVHLQARIRVDNPRRLTNLASQMTGSLRKINARLRLACQATSPERANLMARLEKAGAASVRDALRPLLKPGPYLFRSLKVGLDEKLALFEELSLLGECNRILGKSWPLREALGPSFRWSERLMASPDGAITLLARKQDLAPFGPDPHGPGVQELVLLPFTIRDPSAWSQAQLAVKVASHAENLLLVAQINRRVNLRSYSGGGDKGQWSCHGFDPRVLVAGENEIRITAHRLWGTPGKELVELRQIELLNSTR